MGLTIFQVDAFTSDPFKGNPAGVCILDKERDAIWMQNVAREMNLSETAFLIRREDGFELRWFKPRTEVNLCGHATLASAHIIYETGLTSKEQPVKFFTRSGLLTACLKDNYIELDFPAKTVTKAELPQLSVALGAEILYTGVNDNIYLAELINEDTIKTLKPDFNALLQLPARAIIVTSISTTGKYDFVSRYFAPAVGNNEDPVTGSAHCLLGPYWQEKLGKNNFFAYQVSERGGCIGVRVTKDRVFLTGQAVTVLRCELLQST
jgi:PhzF family phenazine biosynthesis protein